MELKNIEALEEEQIYFRGYYASLKKDVCDLFRKTNGGIEDVINQVISEDKYSYLVHILLAEFWNLYPHVRKYIFDMICSKIDDSEHLSFLAFYLILTEDEKNQLTSAAERILKERAVYYDQSHSAELFMDRAIECRNMETANRISKFVLNPYTAKRFLKRNRNLISAEEKLRLYILYLWSLTTIWILRILFSLGFAIMSFRVGWITIPFLLSAIFTWIWWRIRTRNFLDYGLIKSTKTMIEKIIDVKTGWF
jgi:hypothetical protein